MTVNSIRYDAEYSDATLIQEQLNHSRIQWPSEKFYKGRS